MGPIVFTQAFAAGSGWALGVLAAVAGVLVVLLGLAVYLGGDDDE